MSYIEIRELTKSYKTVVCLDHLSLDIAKGELVAVVGANGAGKSTLLRIVADLILPDFGSIRIDGLDRWEDTEQIKKCTAYLADFPVLFPSFSPRSLLHLIAELYEIPKERAVQLADALLSMFNLKELENRPISGFSKGQYKKVSIAAALITEASLYIFDEPFTGGIDPSGTGIFRRILKRLADDKEVTVLFATQILEIAEEVADKFLILNGGMKAAYGSKEEICDQLGVSQFRDAFDHLTSRDTQEAANRFLNLRESK